jgi:diguanylate cyclase (GGDEF)-like protein
VIAGCVLGSLSVLYLFLLAIVRRADRLIATQAEEVRTVHEALLQYRALHDTLTGLPNRASFADRLRASLAAANRDGEKCAVLFLNIDRFKDINETLGHVVGDKILREVATRLLLCLRETENLARIGGDDFALVLLNVSGTRGVEQILHTAERIRSAISDTAMVVDANTLTVTLSIGIALYPDDGADVVEIMKSADVALYHAKEAGRNQFQFHTSGMNARALEMLLMERDLRIALEKQQFQLHYQAQVDIESGHVVGVEALIRWQHPERGMVGPAKFIPIAEERDLIGRIEAWVIHEACRQNKQWQADGLPPIPVAVNISALHFQQKSFSQEVARILDRSGLSPEYLELELTESSILRDADTTISTMNRLKSLGLKLSLDDFGTGYSSLSQLKRLPLDALKVDQSFVRGLPDDADDLAITTAIIHLGKALNLTVIAEGVETEPQREVLRSSMCDQIQGYLIAKPMPAADFAQFMRQRAKTPLLAG